MSIEINQSLHGYLNGHQLLAGSTELPIRLKKILLFQTDLSGSTLSKGFESYITGYPVEESNLYILSKTWYADEMKRPGCVWTHSLLISFTDISIIPDFKSLLNLFVRPKVGEYNSYNSIIKLDKDALFFKNEYELPYAKKVLLEALYTTPNKTIIIPSANSETFEEIIFSIWSDQWPRLRRNFYFCTGALSLKNFNEREFDIQVIPKSSALSIERQSNNPLIVDIERKDLPVWINILSSFKKLSIRNFLWTYGSDIEGNRSKYIPLLKLFKKIEDSEFNLSSICELFIEFFPSPKEARFIKSHIFGPNVTKVLWPKDREKDIVTYLITCDDISFIDLSEMDLERRLINLIRERGISSRKFLELMINAKQERISDNIWETINIDLSDIIEVLDKNPSYLGKLLYKSPELAYNPIIWQKSLEVQRNILHSLIKQKRFNDLQPIISAIILAGGEILSDANKSLGSIVINTVLDCLNSSDYSKFILNDHLYSFVVNNKDSFLNWLNNNYNTLSPHISNLIFSILNFNDIKQLQFDFKTWEKIYNDIKENDNEKPIVYGACVLLSIGFSNEVNNSDKLIIQTFHDVFKYASKSKIEPTIWSFIPKDEVPEDYDDKIGISRLIYSFFDIPQKKKLSNPPQWDYCEILIRTLVNKYIKYKWSNQSFIDTLKNEDEYYRVYKFCKNFPKGYWFFTQVLNDFESGKIKLTKEQKEIHRNLKDI